MLVKRKVLDRVIYKITYEINCETVLTKHKIPRLKRLEFSANKFITFFGFKFKLKMKGSSEVYFKALELNINEIDILSLENVVKLSYRSGINYIVNPYINTGLDELQIETRSFK